MTTPMGTCCAKCKKLVYGTLEQLRGICDTCHTAPPTPNTGTEWKERYYRAVEPQNEFANGDDGYTTARNDALEFFEKELPAILATQKSQLIAEGVDEVRKIRKDMMEAENTMYVAGWNAALNAAQEIITKLKGM